MKSMHTSANRAFLGLSLTVMALGLAGCAKIERDAYTLFTGGKAALLDYRMHHPECRFDPLTGMSPVLTMQPCLANNKLTAAKDTLIDAAEIYCSSVSFENGGPCTPPAKGTPAYQQVADKLQAAINNYRQTADDLKGVF